jgi:Bacterial PH domain
MSSNAPQFQQPQDDPWVPKREYDNFRRVRRVGTGKKRHYEFKGQQPGETVKMVLRRHKFFLITPALPLIATIIGLIVMYVLAANYPQAGPLWSLLELIFFILIIVTGIYFLYHDLALWWLEVDIITDKRVIAWKGFLNPHRQEIPNQNIVQVAVDQRGVWSRILTFGDLHFYMSGGRALVLKHIPDPKKVRDSLQNITTTAKEATKTPPVEPVVFTDPDLTEVLAKLAKNEPVPTLPNADEKYARNQRSDRPRGPLRSFGGPLHLPCDVTYIPDEYTVLYVQRSKYVLVGKLIIPILLVLALIIATIYVHTSFPWTVIGIFVMLFVIAFVIINFIDDVYIFTNRRVIEIERRAIFLSEEHDSTEYTTIKDIKVNIRNPLELAFDIGNVIIETPGNNPDITLSLVDHPFSIQDMAIAIKGFKEKVDKAKAKNERKNQLNEWFGTVLTVLEKKMVNRGVPNLQKLDLWTAAELARELGMKVVPVGEDSSYPNIAPGLIVDQNPVPGTLMKVDSEDPENRPQIRVILSGRP